MCMLRRAPASNLGAHSIAMLRSLSALVCRCQTVSSELKHGRPLQSGSACASFSVDQLNVFLLTFGFRVPRGRAFGLSPKGPAPVFVQTWLILPVVICLSQRLSHACLSISVSLRNCEWLIKTVIVSMSVVYYLDIHGNSRANTCVQTRLLRKGCAY